MPGKLRSIETTLIFGSSVVSIAMALVVGGVSLVLLSWEFHGPLGGEVEQLLHRELEQVVEAAAADLNGDQLERVYRSGTARSADYEALQTTLRNIQARFRMKSDIYTLHLDGERTRFGLTCKSTALIGQEYELTDTMRRVFEGGPIGTTGAYGDDHGWWISAYAPVRNSNGVVVALVEADFDLTRHIQETRNRVLRSSFIALGIGVLAAVVFSFFSARRISRPLRRLSALATQISEGDLDPKELDVSGNDEIGRIAESFQRTLAALRYYQLRVEELENGASGKDEGEGEGEGERKDEEPT